MMVEGPGELVGLQESNQSFVHQVRRGQRVIGALALKLTAGSVPELRIKPSDEFALRLACALADSFGQRGDVDRLGGHGSDSRKMVQDPGGFPSNSTPTLLAGKQSRR